MREPLRIPDAALRACLRDQYDLPAVTVQFLPLGLDTRAAVYRVGDEQGRSHLLRVQAGPVNAPGYRVPRYLRDQGIEAVVAPLRTTRDTLWTRIGDGSAWTAALYPFIVGETGWHPGLSGEQWRALGAALAQIHRTPLPPGGIAALRAETFEPAAYVRWAQSIDAHVAGRLPGEDGSESEQALVKQWTTRRTALRAMLAAMSTLAETLRAGSGPYVICHADLHPGNVIRDGDGGVHVIDWDDVMLAPKERDFIFVETPEGESVSGALPAFFQGYGPAAIDWAALTYYRFERVVQDLLVCAQDVLFRDDLEEETKADSAQLFAGIFGPGDEVDAAWATATRLPPNLHLRLRLDTARDAEG